MRNKSKKITKKEFSTKEIQTIFEQIRPAEKIFTPVPNPEIGSDISDRWILTSGSSKQNKLIQIAAWQTGQIS